MRMDKKTVKNIANSLADEMARKMYYKLLMLKFLPEIKAGRGKGYTYKEFKNKFGGWDG